MESLDTLIFPDTNIFHEECYPLLLFFTPLHFLQLVEPGSDSNADDEAAHFLKSGLCQAHIPAPLGDNQEKFLRLIGDMKARSKEYVAQLRTLIIDCATAPAGSEAANPKHTIISSLLHKHGIKHYSSEAELNLWQARLVLALAEILYKNEDDLHDELSFFTEEEIAMFHILQKENEQAEDEPLSELDNLRTQQEKHHVGNTIKRFEAWLRLLKNRPAPRVNIWLTTTRVSADQVFARYESANQGRAVPVLKLVFPAHIMASGKYVIEQIQAFQQASRHIRQGLITDFQRIVTTVPYVADVHESLLPYKTDWAEQWQVMLEDYFPAAKDGRSDVTFYLLPNQTIPKLLSLPTPDDTTIGHAAHGLLALRGSSS